MCWRTPRRWCNEPSLQEAGGREASRVLSRGWYSGDGLNSGSFGIYGSPNPGGKVEPVEAEIDAVLEDIKATASARTNSPHQGDTHRDTVYARDNQGNLARAFGSALTTGSCR